ncbi:BIG/ATPase V1 complex, subunit S1 [Lipomyces japonicus]|uniref:BIG/ATPase V1 complex, subunit S1 n=1 Tax=Lipomyces japonicus TaxID=56871 RepID=UPI0034CE06F2
MIYKFSNYLCRVPAVHEHISGASITSSGHFEDLARKLVLGHQADVYVVVNQPGLHASDFSAVSAERTTPNLRKLFDQAETAYAVRNAHGSFDIESLEKHIVDTYGADTVVIDAASDAFSLPTNDGTKVIRLEFPVLPVDYTRAATLADNDAFLYSVMSLVRTENYAVIFASTPISRPFAKRGTAASNAVPTNTTDAYPTGVYGYPTGSAFPTEIPEGARTDGSLFTRYQFFTPGIFMSIIASLILIFILGIGLKSIASIKISYDAFEKETGPQQLAQQSIKK